MLRLNSRAIEIWVQALVLYLAASAYCEPSESALTPGNTLPPLAGQTITGKKLTLPPTPDETQAVVIFSFSRAGGRDAKNWTQHLSENYPQLTIYVAIFLESVPRPFRSMAVSSIRSGMSPLTQERTMLVYSNQDAWKQSLHVSNESQASVVVLDPSRHIQWITSGPFADSLYEELRKQIHDRRADRK